MIKFDIEIWRQPFISNKNPVVWRCGLCGVGSIKLVQKISASQESRISTAKASCTNSTCNKEHVLIGDVKPFSGPTEVSFAYHKIGDYGLFPTHFKPELSLFVLPHCISEGIREKLSLSFNHFWYDLDACANKVRQALELIVVEFGGTGDSLHKKIESLKGRLEKGLIHKLSALKWIGNEGSHSDEPFTKAQVLEMYRILVSALNMLFPDDENDKLEKQLVENINNNKGIKKS